MYIDTTVMERESSCHKYKTVWYVLSRIMGILQSTPQVCKKKKEVSGAEL